MIKLAVSTFDVCTIFLLSGTFKTLQDDTQGISRKETSAQMMKYIYDSNEGMI